MYLEFYGLREQPFHITANPDFLYLSPSHREALGAIIYGISHRKGFVAISGEVGMGKTTILRTYLEGADPAAHPENQKVVYIFNANLSFAGLLHTFFRELAIIPPAGETYEMVDFLHTVLIEEYRQGQTVVLVIDEAQNMPLETLENLRMLSNLETSREKLLQIVLIGQPEFDAHLNLPQMRQLSQRIAVRARIKALNQRESLAYLQHRLSRVTPAPQAVFTPSALRQIAREGDGTPRILNILADNALIAGYGYQKKPVTSAIVRETIADYRGYRPSMRFHWLLVPAGLAVLAVTLIPAVVQHPEQPLPPPQPIAVNTEIIEPDTLSSTTPQIDTAVPETFVEPVEQTLPSPPQPIRHVVRKGENLTQISKEIYGVADADTLKFILTQNPQIQHPNQLPSGAALILPPHPSPAGGER